MVRFLRLHNGPRVNCCYAETAYLFLEDTHKLLKNCYISWLALPGIPHFRAFAAL